MFSAPKDVDVYLGDFYADETFNIIKHLLGNRFLEIRSPPQVNDENPDVSSVILHGSDEVEIKLARNYIQTGSVTPKFATNVNDGDMYCVLIGQNGDKLDVLCVFNFRILKIIDFLDMKLYAYINLLARKQSEPGDTISISGTNCWRIFSSLLCAIKYPDDMKIPVPGLELIFEAGLLTQNTELTGCIGNASDNKSEPFWNSRQGATENGSDYNEYMDPKELELTTEAGGGAFEILLDPGIALEELGLAAETIKTSSTASATSASAISASAISADSSPPEEDEDTSCVNSLREKERDIIFKNKEQTIEGLSQKIDEKIRNSQDSVLLPKLYDLKGKTIRTSQKLTQQSQPESQISSSVQADNSKNTRPREEEDAVVRGEQLQAEMIEENEPKWIAAKKMRELNKKLNQEEQEQENNKKNALINKESSMYIADPDEGSQLDPFIGGGRRPRRQRRKTKRNNKQTKRRKQKTNKRVKKRQTKRIKKKQTKKV
jgi:hypothetical protein